jgi:hypothetical protein
MQNSKITLVSIERKISTYEHTTKKMCTKLNKIETSVFGNRQKAYDKKFAARY